jgi:hypothetical protein
MPEFNLVGLKFKRATIVVYFCAGSKPLKKKFMR